MRVHIMLDKPLFRRRTAASSGVCEDKRKRKTRSIECPSQPITDTILLSEGQVDPTSAKILQVRGIFFTLSLNFGVGPFELLMVGLHWEMGLHREMGSIGRWGYIEIL